MFSNTLTVIHHEALLYVFSNVQYKTLLLCPQALPSPNFTRIPAENKKYKIGNEINRTKYESEEILTVQLLNARSVEILLKILSILWLVRYQHMHMLTICVKEF